jgi:hypothetical protein
MMPIAQSFLVSSPASGAPGVFLTGLDLYFFSSDSSLGVEVQIRRTDNGVPNSKIVPFGSKILQASSIKTSVDASIATNFTFDTPVILQTNQQYAIVVIPAGQNPNYKIWTGVVGGTDTVTKNPIYTGNQLGSLFISTNDLNFTAVQGESMKYNLYTSQFSSPASTYAVYRNSNTDYFYVRSLIGNFVVGEQVVVSNNSLSLASFSISAGVNTFNTSDTVTQVYSGGVANGKVLFCNTSYLVLANVQGSFNTSNVLTDTTISKTVAAPSSANQTIVSTSGANSINVPCANTTIVPDFTVGNFIYVGTNNRSTVKVAQITAATVSNNTLSLSTPIPFTDSASLIGRVKADGNLYGLLSVISTTPSYSLLALDKVTSNAATNFVGSNNQYLIGTSSGASAITSEPMNLYYDSLTPQLTSITPTLTTQDWNFRGISNTMTVDTSYTLVSKEVPYEFVDQSRMLMSRSNEIVYNSGVSSIQLKTNLISSNNYISPYIDSIRSSSTLTRNLVSQQGLINGVILSISNSTGTFVVGDTIWQGNSTSNNTATVYSSNSSTIFAYNVNNANTLTMGVFAANSTTIVDAANSSVNATITAVSTFGEQYGIGLSTVTRYISKNVVLAAGQDADDLTCYVDAWRPPGTNVLVYGKCLSSLDNDKFSLKPWTLLTETTSVGLYSSAVNKNNIVELVYNIPTSVNLFGNSAVTNTATNVVTMPSFGSTSKITAGSFIYISDSSVPMFNIRQVLSVPNSTAIILTSNVSSNTTNAAIGLIPGLNIKTGIFRYDQKNNIARYSTTNDGIFDTFLQFAIKIVLVSNNTYLSPKISDMRALALQV